MTRALPLLLSLALSACAPGVLDAGFEEALTERCAFCSAGGDGDLSLQAADPEATVKLWVWVEGALDGLGEGESRELPIEIGEAFTVAVTTGENLREPCSDVAMNEVQLLHYEASEGSATLLLEPWDDQGDPTWLATLALADLVLEPEEGGEPVTLAAFAFEAVEIWER